MSLFIAAAAVCVIAALTCIGWAFAAHVVFTEGAQIRKAKRDAELSALRALGKDTNRPMDV